MKIQESFLSFSPLSSSAALGHVLLHIYFPFSLTADPCATDNGGCNQTCTNSKGSPVCSCKGGFELADDKKGCNGENEHLQYMHRHVACTYN